MSALWNSITEVLLASRRSYGVPGSCICTCDVLLLEQQKLAVTTCLPKVLSLSVLVAAEPQVTTDPSARMAAKARSEAWICCTFFSRSCTSLLSPPNSASPGSPSHDGSITENGGKAPSEAWICCTFFPLSCTALLSPPKPA